MPETLDLSPAFGTPTSARSQAFDNPRGAQLGLMSAIMSLGSICSTPIAPWVADKYGRRMGITVGKLIMIIGAILQCESHNFGMFVGSRFVLGFGLSFATTSAPVSSASCRIRKTASR
ncbi:High-affinity glucose transporter like protein [Verticillium longisporum]|nr:High-affinity glucose transporter like protein [Verticillium longisporum]